ncbi:hypothetical protein DPM19_18200 [Actinomadura craniellae]|uniref:Tyr recombinase domain-containing protein n=1 Tax=Actinomadura craniellae TaxID=2231787 RepID=A0A365H3D8_9ACTN|nr:tyrosine-type recombinase/integrase [Actinomadura craniellae]RAY13611.1 hypothetical protein DPM19_18200 [Actinomadura craniellae]
MARVKDLWFSEVSDPANPKKRIKRKTKRHPDNGGSKDAKRWLAVWVDPDGKEKSRAFKKQVDAKTHAGRMEADVDRGEYIDPDAGKNLLGPLGRKWLRLCDVGGNAYLRYETALRLHVEPTFAERRVSAVLPSEVLEWQRALSKARGESTVELAHWILRSIFDMAVADGMRKDNPVRSPIVPVPRRDTKEREPWDVGQVWTVIDHHPDPYRAIPIVSAGCGVRQGEAFGLAVDDFDFDAGKVHIGRQLIRVGKRIVFKLPKGGKTRDVPLSPGVAATARAHIDAYPPVRCSLPWMGEDGEVDDEHTAMLLFVWRGGEFLPNHQPAEGEPRRRGRGAKMRSEGQNLQTSSFNEKVWKPAIAAAGIIGPAVKNQWSAYSFEAAREHGPHALRHWFSTTLLDAGVPLNGVMDFMGHSRKGLPVTLGVYGHTTEETFEAARNAIDRSLFRLRAVQDQHSDGTVAEQAGTA